MCSSDLITVTEENLAKAEADREKQYEDMKKRIQYMYENGGSSAWINMLNGADDISTLLNKAEYAQSMHDYDRDQLNVYIAVVEQVKELKAELETQKTELETQKSELETQKADLESQKQSLESQKADLESQEYDLRVRLDNMKETRSDYESQIAAAQAQAAEISSLIQEQEQELARMEAERLEAERRAQEEAAAREQAAREEAARQEAARQQETISASSSSSSSNSGSSSSSNSSSSSSSSGSSSSSSSSSGSTSSSSSSSSSYAPGGSSGSAIVAYADQFVGNPYVWGGNSLTNGIDCSHFVYQVLKNCGVYSGGYVTSSGWRSQGRAVSSLSEAQAGDVICYSGHVAIYDGAGGIVEAKGSAWGITHDRSATCKTILAIRRFT